MGRGSARPKGFESAGPGKITRLKIQPRHSPRAESRNSSNASSSLATPCKFDDKVSQTIYPFSQEKSEPLIPNHFWSLDKSLEDLQLKQGFFHTFSQQALDSQTNFYGQPVMNEILFTMSEKCSPINQLGFNHFGAGSEALTANFSLGLQRYDSQIIPFNIFAGLNIIDDPNRSIFSSTPDLKVAEEKIGPTNADLHDKTFFTDNYSEGI